MVRGMGLMFLLALLGWAASQAREPRPTEGALEAPSLSLELHKALASVCQPAVPLLLNMAVIVGVVTFVRWGRAALRPAGASAGPVVPESAEVRAHTNRQHEDPGPQLG